MNWAAKCRCWKAEAHALAGQPFNLNSPKQLAEILFTQQGLPVVKKTPSGGPSTDEEVLEKLAEDYPLPRKILDYRSLAKLKNTYTDKLPQMVERTHRPCAHQLCASGGGHRTARLIRAQFAKHPCAHRRRATHPFGFHCRTRPPYHQRRLFADRAAHHGTFVA
jgi:hypothetical protein